MADDLNVMRNFRVAYYDKVGFRGVGEKTLNGILRDDVIDTKKLENFCVRYSIQSSYRFLIWKVLLDILPIHQQSHKFVMSQRSEQYHDLHHALQVMHLIDDATSVPDVYLRMRLLETGDLCCGFEPADWHNNFTAIAASLVDIADCDVDGYWMTVAFYNFFERLKISDYKKEFNDIIVSTLKRESKKLDTHLEILNFFPSDTVNAWHEQCFASILQSGACIEKIWDVLLGKAVRILPYVSASLLLTVERFLLKSKSLVEANTFLNSNPFSEEVTELSCRNALEYWKKGENV